MLGACGVLVGTRFYATEEAAGARAAKERICAATGDDTARSIVSISRGKEYGRLRLPVGASATLMHNAGLGVRSNCCSAPMRWLPVTRPRAKPATSMSRRSSPYLCRPPGRPYAEPETTKGPRLATRPFWVFLAPRPGLEP